MKDMKEKIRWLVGGTLLLSAMGFGIFSLTTATINNGYAGWENEREYHDDDDDDHYRGYRGGYQTPVTMNDRYQEECGACHYAYPPGLLPAISWREIMNNLDNHYGENAELPAESVKEIAQWLEPNSSDLSPRAADKKMLRGLRGEIPLRITELPYFRHEHHEIPEKFIKNNPKVVSLSHCDACHQDGIKTGHEGMFDEDYVHIPGFGRWDD